MVAATAAAAGDDDDKRLLLLLLSPYDDAVVVDSPSSSSDDSDESYRCASCRLFGLFQAYSYPTNTRTHQQLLQPLLALAFISALTSCVIRSIVSVF